MKKLDFDIPKGKHNIKARLSYSEGDFSQLQQLIIMATGLHSHMDKESQVKMSDNYRQAGFATLQFNFTAHGQGENKSGGTMKEVTLSSSIQDLKTVWDYSKTQLPKNIDVYNAVIAANSYGALISLLALEKNLITPESMVLVAPFSFDKFKPWILPLRIIAKMMPDKISQILKLPVSSEMVKDFLKHHTKGMRRKNLLGSTAVHFFVGAEDKIASVETVKKWSYQFNKDMPSQVPFVDNLQAHCMVYPGVPHFEIPDHIQQDISDRSIKFIRNTHKLRSY